MSSLVNLYEAPVATIQEKLKLNRVASVGIIAVAGCVVSLVIPVSYTHLDVYKRQVHVTEATNDTPRPRLMSLPCNM